MTKKRSTQRPVRKVRARSSKRRVSGAIRIFAKLELGQELAKRITAAPLRAGFDRPVTLEGKTQHFQVYYQTGFPSGPAIADGVLATNEGDLHTLEGFFGGLALPTLPMNIIVAPGIGAEFFVGADRSGGRFNVRPNLRKAHWENQRLCAVQVAAGLSLSARPPLGINDGQSIPAVVKQCQKPCFA